MNNPTTPSIQRSDTVTTKSSDDLSGHSTQDGQQLSPTDSPSSSSMASNPPRAGTASSCAGRRRKVPDSVTANACTNCKKARAKCDGATPVCRRCNNRSIQDSCQYELHAKTAKDQMLREIQRLQQKNEHLEEEKGTLGEKNSWIEEIMHSLKRDGQRYEIINRLKHGDSHQAIAEWLGRPQVGKGVSHPVSPTTAHQISEAFDIYHKRVESDNGPGFWTNVTQDEELIEHLIILYLTWIHPVHMLFDETRFLTSFRNCVDVYCAHSLVSAICAMSCHLLHSININDNETKAAVSSLGDRFLNESRFLLKSAEQAKMTTVQTYAVMFLAEFGSGQGLKGASHLRLATEILVDKQIAEQSAEALSVSAWGVLTLHTAWSAMSYQKPTTPVSTDAEPFSTEIPHYADGLWRLHRQLGDTDTSERRGFSVMTASQHAKLFRIVHELLLVYCGSRGRVGANHLLNTYKRFLSWKDEMPPELLDGRDDPLPHVLFLHIQYHTAIIQLLQPVVHLEHFNRDSYKVLIGFVLQHARAGLQLLMRYRNLYSSFYLSPLQLVCLVQLCDALVRYDSTGQTTPQPIHFCLAFLEDAKGGYPLAGPLQMMFRQALADYNIPVPDELERMMGSAASLGTEELLDACTRATYRQPINHILPNMDINMAEDFVAGWQQLESRERPEKETPAAAFVNDRAQRLDIGSLLNPSLPPRPRPAAPPPPKPRRIGIYIASGLLVYALTTYGTSLYWTLTSPTATPLPAQDADVSSRYDTTAPHFDQDVSFIERLSSLTRLRRRLVSQAHGDVLEASVGTGRNALYYDIEKCRSVTFVDQSVPMVEIARKKWQALHPDFDRAAFYTQSAQLPLPTPPEQGFTTVVQTMGVCSTPQPAAALAHLGSLAHATEGRVLLLEHGRSYYEWINWILDRSAARHADRHGCWFNRDVGEVVRGSGLVVDRVERSQFGTVWYVEARPPVGRVGEGGVGEGAVDTAGTPRKEGARC